MSALPYPELAGFLAALREQPGASARALEFAILTAARTGETIGATWREIDMVARIWTVPAERIKGGKEHRVPLSDQAVAILASLPREAEFVFPGGRKGKPLSNMALLKTLHRMKRDDLTTHGFRSTFRDWAAETTAYPNEVVEMALAHAIESKVEAAYRRGDLFEKRRWLMADWAAYCEAPARSARWSGLGSRSMADRTLSLWHCGPTISSKSTGSNSSLAAYSRCSEQSTSALSINTTFRIGQRKLLLSECSELRLAKCAHWMRLLGSNARSASTLLSAQSYGIARCGMFTLP